MWPRDIETPWARARLNLTRRKVRFALNCGTTKQLWNAMCVSPRMYALYTLADGIVHHGIAPMGNSRQL